MPQPTVQEKVLVVLLRFGAVVTFMAFFTMLLPEETMARAHRWLGLGEFPASPLVDYLTRSISALYGFHGVLLFLVSRDVVRYRPIVIYLGIMNLVLGLMLLAIDLHAGMPWYWTVAEGPGLLLLGPLILYLSRSLP